MMPEGVEHAAEIAKAFKAFVVTDSMMPEGVEHVCDCSGSKL